MWGGDENKWDDVKFRFFCDNEECYNVTGDKYFTFVYEKAPKKIPKTIKCPICNSRCLYSPTPPGVRFIGSGWTSQTGNAESNESKAREYYQQFIADGKDAIKFESGVSPYTKMELNHEYWAKRGAARKVSSTEAAEREKRGRMVAQEAAKRMTKDEISKTGRRSDG